MSAASTSYPSPVARSGAAPTTRPSPATGAIASSTPVISSSLAARGQRPGGAPVQAGRRGPGRYDRRYHDQRCRLGIEGRYPGQVEPEPDLVLDEALVDHRQLAQEFLGPGFLVHAAHLPSRAPCISGQGGRFCPCETVIWPGPGRSADFPGGLLDGFVDVLRAYVEFLGYVLLGLQRGLVEGLFHLAVPDDDQCRLSRVDDVPQFLDI